MTDSALPKSAQATAAPSPSGMYTVCFTLPEAAAAARGSGIGDGEELGYVTEAEVIAVTSRIQLRDWLGASGDAHLGDLTWVAPRACRHQAIIEAVMGLAPAFPLSFGAVWSSEEKLRQYLRRFHDPIREFLSFISDKEEWTIKGALDQAQYDALHSGPQAEPLASSPPSGTGYLLAQKQRASAAVKTRDWLQLAEGVVLDNLRPLTLMRRRRRILPAQAGDSDRLAFHWAVLIERSQRDSLLRLLDRGNDHWAPLGLKLIGQGPWPT